MATGESCRFKKILSLQMKHNFNSFTVDKVFKQSRPLLIVGHEDGMIRMYELPKVHSPDTTKDPITQASFETKGGPIQSLIVHDVTKLYGANDLIVADSCGVVTILCNEQILSRKIVSDHSIRHLKVDVDSAGNFSIVMADCEGVISSFTPYNDLWKLRLADVRQLKGLSKRPKVKCMLGVTLNTRHGYPINYVLIADDARHLCFLQQCTPVLVIQTPANITAMCSGKFVEQENIEAANGESLPSCSSSYDTQVALGTESGAIYVMTNFEIYEDEYANIRMPITHLSTLKASDSQATDTLLAAGDFDSLCVLREGKVVASHLLQSWVNCMVTADLDEDGVKEVIVGCHNNTIHGLKLTFS